MGSSVSKSEITETLRTDCSSPSEGSRHRNRGEGMNSEGYKDETAERAIRHATQTPDDVMQVIRMMKAVASVAGFDVIGRIQLKDRASGKEFR